MFRGRVQPQAGALVWDGDSTGVPPEPAPGRRERGPADVRAALRRRLAPAAYRRPVSMSGKDRLPKAVLRPGYTCWGGLSVLLRGAGGAAGCQTGLGVG